MALISPRFGKVGSGTYIGLPIDVLTNPKGIQLGSGIFVRAHCRLESVAVEQGEEPGRIVVGDRTHVEGYCSISAARLIEIGADVLIGGNVTIRDHDHGYQQPYVHPIRQPLIAAPVSIGSFVWLGQNVVVTKGVTIGAGAVVGANAVVTKSVPSGAIVVGVPAKQVGWTDGRPYSQEPTESAS
jgi:carbonic anhydrase/acetyltransferase-like protein (isoleucine patch superfamily)